MERLYEQDAYLRAFTARVLACRETDPGRWQAELDRTAFYPEGGGQPCDLGDLGGAAVLDVQQTGGKILHTLDRPLSPGETVTGRIDWARRFDHMQQHSGEHICSGLLCRRFSCRNAGFHLGRETVTIDLTAPVSFQELLETQDAANAYIAADVPVQTEILTPQERQGRTYRCRREREGPMRIVTFPGADCCGCGGTHVNSSGQVGLVKFLSAQPFRGGTRIELVCGGRAVSLLCRVYDQARLAGGRLSVPPQGLPDAVGRVLQELSDARALARRWEEMALPALAEPYRGKGRALLICDAMPPDTLGRLGRLLAEVCGGPAAVFAGAEGDFRYVLSQGGGADLSPLSRQMTARLGARGGGRGGMFQGSAPCRRDGIEAFFREVW